VRVVRSLRFDRPASDTELKHARSLTRACALAGEACVCRASTDPHGTALASPWHPSIVRMAGGLNTDACSGPFERCVHTVRSSASTGCIQLDSPLLLLIP
jgi:hypothetical protein